METQTNEIIANNKLIAEFMGVKPNHGDWFDGYELWNAGLPFAYGAMGNGTDMLEFNSSMDWLMPVIIKIERMGYEVLIGRIYCQIHEILQPDKPIQKIVCGNISKKIETVFITIVKFLEWYNNQNK